MDAYEQHFERERRLMLARMKKDWAEAWPNVPWLCRLLFGRVLTRVFQYGFGCGAVYADEANESARWN